MNTQAVQFVKYIEENAVSGQSGDLNSMLVLFSSYYRIYNPIDSEKIRNRFQSVEPIMKSLSRKRENRLFHTMLDICEECESEAFLEGLCVGAQLIMELSE